MSVQQTTAGGSAVAAVVVLAAGQGTRMRSATPKVLHTLGGRSLLGHVLAAAEPLRAGATVVVVGSGRAAVEEHLGRIAPAALPVLQAEQRGSGHAAACSSVARVSSTGPPGRSSSSRTMAPHCAAVLPGREILIVHGSRDRIASPDNSAAVARALSRTADVGYIRIEGGKHAMLKHHSLFDGLAADFAAATLLGTPQDAGPVARVLAGERWIDL